MRVVSEGGSVNVDTGDWFERTIPALANGRVRLNVSDHGICVYAGKGHGKRSSGAWVDATVSDLERVMMVGALSEDVNEGPIQMYHNNGEYLVTLWANSDRMASALLSLEQYREFCTCMAEVVAWQVGR